jgi:hypothetical protein
MILQDALIEALSGFLPVYADDAPNDPPYPHCVLRMDGTASAALTGDSATLARRRSFELAVYDRQDTEDDRWPQDLSLVLSGSMPGYRIRIQGWRRVVDQTFRVVEWILDGEATDWTSAGPSTDQ